MASGDARAARARDPRRVQVLDRHGAPRWHELWVGNPDIARPGERGNLQSLRNGPGVRPYHLAKSDERWTFNPAYRATPGRIVLTAAEQELADRHAGRIIVEPLIKAKAPANKQWGWVRWNKLAWILAQRGHRVTQLGPDPREVLDGADYVVTPRFRDACAVLSTARAAVLPEGGLHHAAAAFNVPAVVIFGGFTPVELTGYDLHHNIGARLGDACGMRKPCDHCAAWMASITPEHVADQLEKILAKRDEGMARPLAA